MLHVYGMAYWVLDYANKTIDNLLESSTEKLHITVVEGKSKHSADFLAWAKDCLSKGKIQRFITADDNCKGAGLIWAFNNYPPDKSENFCIFTDLDVLVPKGVDWVKAIRIRMKKKVVVGFDLSTENYVPPNYGFSIGDEYYGNWLMACNLRVFKKYPLRSFQDSEVIQHMLKSGESVKIPIKLTHLGWDAWKDDPEYWAFKIDNLNWQSASNLPITYTVYE